MPANLPTARTAFELISGVEHLNEPWLAYAATVRNPDTIDWPDLAIAWLAARGEPTGLERIEALIAEQTKRVISGFPHLASYADDVCQLVRVRVSILGSDGKRGIAQYSGRGPLASWVRTAAVREAIRIGSRKSEAPGSRALPDVLAQLAAAGEDPEIRMLKAQFGEHFRAAFDDAVASLDERARSLIFMNHVEGVSIDELATVYRIHRSTAARRVAAARTELVKGLRESLGRRLSLETREIDSLLRLVDSRLSISLGALAPADGGDTAPNDS